MQDWRMMSSHQRLFDECLCLVMCKKSCIMGCIQVINPRLSQTLLQYVACYRKPNPLGKNNLQYAPNCLEHRKCIKMDLKCIQLLCSTASTYWIVYSWLTSNPKISIWAHTRAKIHSFSKCQNSDHFWGCEKSILQIQPDHNETCLYGEELFFEQKK